MNKDVCYGCEYFYVCREKYIPHGECLLSLGEPESDGTGCVLGLLIGAVCWLAIALAVFYW